MEELLPLLGEAAADLKPVLDILKDLGGTLSALSGGLNLATAATGALSAGLSQAVGAVMGPFAQLGSVIAPFVQALNPSLMFAFNQAMRSLQATIGVALVPVMQVLTGTVREVAGILLPAMEALAPVFGSLAKAALELFLPPFRLISDLLQALAPVLEFMAGVLQVVSEAWNALSVVGRTIYQTFYKLIAQLFGGTDLKDVLKSFRDAMHSVVEAVFKLVAYLAKAFGSLGFIDAMTKNLREMANSKAGAAPAPQDVGFKGFEDIAKTMAAAAFAAQPGGGAEDKSEREWLKHLADSLDEVKRNKVDVKTFVVEGITDFWTKTGKRAVGDMVNNVSNAVISLPLQIARAIRGLLPT